VIGTPALKKVQGTNLVVMNGFGLSDLESRAAAGFNSGATIVGGICSNFTL
jgi:hypothetical protein